MAPPTSYDPHYWQWKGHLLMGAPTFKPRNQLSQSGDPVRVVQLITSRSGVSRKALSPKYDSTYKISISKHGSFIWTSVPSVNHCMEHGSFIYGILMVLFFCIFLLCICILFIGLILKYMYYIYDENREI